MSPPRIQQPAAIAAAALIAALMLSLALLGLGRSATAGAATPRASLPTIEREVMCVTCKITLQVAESPQADREKDFIQQLIDRGEDESEIKSALVLQYGPNVLALPAAHGFDLTVYLVPAAVILALLGLLATMLPRWRRQARAQAVSAEQHAGLSPGDADRLDSDLARFD